MSLPPWVGVPWSPPSLGRLAALDVKEAPEPALVFGTSVGESLGNRPRVKCVKSTRVSEQRNQSRMRETRLMLKLYYIHGLDRWRFWHDG